MLSVGFEPQLQRLKALLLDRQPAGAAEEVAAKPSKKKHKKQNKVLEERSNQGPAAVQVLLFSATLPKAVRQTADAWLKPGYVSVSCSAGADSISRTITQVGLLHGDALWCAVQNPSVSYFVESCMVLHHLFSLKQNLLQSPPARLPDVVYPETHSLYPHHHPYATYAACRWCRCVQSTRSRPSC